MKVLVITGSSTGVGFALGNYFAKKKFKVYGLSRTTPINVNFTTIPTDVTQKGEVENAIQHIYKAEGKIDFIINNAGKGMMGSIEDTTESEIFDLFKLNLIACVHIFASALPIMRENKGGKIINISSIGSEMGLPFRGFYSASKSALDKITEAMRYELMDTSIQVTSLHLGDIQTNIAANRIISKVSKTYKNNYEKVYININEHVTQGLSAESVAPFIEKLFCKNKLKTHYYFGSFSQKTGVILKKIMPSLWFEKMIRKYSGF